MDKMLENMDPKLRDEIYNSKKPSTEALIAFLKAMEEEDEMEEGGFKDDGVEKEARTGNEVPPGSLDQEVSDTMDAKLSEGEYVLPADVVRFLGLGKIEAMVDKAKKSLEEMEAKGRIGGEAVDEEGVPTEELTPEEQQMLMEAMAADPEAETTKAFAQGGAVEKMGMANQGQSPFAPEPVVPGPEIKPEDDQMATLGVEPLKAARDAGKTGATAPADPDEGSNVGIGPEIDMPEAPTVAELSSMSPTEFHSHVSNRNEQVGIVGSLSPVGIVSAPIAAVNMVNRSREEKAMEENPDLATPENKEAVSKKSPVGLKKSAMSIARSLSEQVSSEISDSPVGQALGLGKEDSEGEDAGPDTGKGSEAEGGPGPGGDADGGDGGDGGPGGDGDGDGGGAGEGGPGGDAGYTKGGLVKRRPPNKRKKPVKKKKYGLGTRP